MDFIDSIINTIGTISFIILGISVIILVLVIRDKRAAKARHSTIDSSLSSSHQSSSYLARRKPDFTPDRQYIDVFNRCGISVNSDRTKLLRVLYDRNEVETYRKVYDYSEIVSCEILFDNEVYTKGAAFIHPGTIGFAHGSSTSQNIVNEIKLNIIFRDNSHPHQEIYFMHSIASVKIPNAKEKAYELYSFINLMIEKQKDSLREVKETFHEGVANEVEEEKLEILTNDNPIQLTLRSPIEQPVGIPAEPNPVQPETQATRSLEVNEEYPGQETE